MPSFLWQLWLLRLNASVAHHDMDLYVFCVMSGSGKHSNFSSVVNFRALPTSVPLALILILWFYGSAWFYVVFFLWVLRLKACACAWVLCVCLNAMVCLWSQDNFVELVFSLSFLHRFQGLNSDSPASQQAFLCRVSFLSAANTSL